MSEPEAGKRIKNGYYRNGNLLKSEQAVNLLIMAIDKQDPTGII